MTTSIVVPLLDRWDLTEKCLAAVESFTPEDHEVILVDNGSTDETAERDVAIRNPENRGFATACDQGARVASGDVIVFLNNDTQPCCGWLPPLLATLARPHIVAAGPKLIYPDGGIQSAGVEVDFTKPFGTEAWNVQTDSPRREVAAVTGACLAVRADAFFEVGGFDRGYWNGYEDVDLCLSLREHGGRIMYEPGSVVVHLESQSDPAARFAAVRQNVARLRAKWSM